MWNCDFLFLLFGQKRGVSFVLHWKKTHRWTSREGGKKKSDSDPAVAYFFFASCFLFVEESSWGEENGMLRRYLYV